MSICDWHGRTNVYEVGQCRSMRIPLEDSKLERVACNARKRPHTHKIHEMTLLMRSVLKCPFKQK